MPSKLTKILLLIIFIVLPPLINPQPTLAQDAGCSHNAITSTYDESGVYTIKFRVNANNCPFESLELHIYLLNDQMQETAYKTITYYDIDDGTEDGIVTIDITYSAKEFEKGNYILYLYGYPGNVSIGSPKTISVDPSVFPEEQEEEEQEEEEQEEEEAGPPTLHAGEFLCTCTNWDKFTEISYYCTTSTVTADKCRQNEYYNSPEDCEPCWYTPTSPDNKYCVLTCHAATQDSKSITCTSPNGNQGINTAIGCIPINDTNPLFIFLLKWAMSLIGGIAFFLLLYAILQIIVSQGNPKRLTAGKELLIAVITAIIFLIISALLLKTIGVDIYKIPGFSTS